MFSRIFNKLQTAKLKEVQIGDGNLTLDLPTHLKIEQEQDATTTAYDPDMKGAMVRFSTLYLSKESNPNARDLAFEGIAKSAKEKKLKLKKIADKQFYTYVESSGTTDEDLTTIHYWVVGLDNTIVLISCWLQQGVQTAQSAQTLLKTIESAISSLRLSRIQSYKSEEAFQQELLPLSTEHSQALEEWRQIVYGVAKSKGHAFLGTSSDLRTLQLLLDDNALVEKSNSLLLDGLGVIFGDILAKKLDLHWMTVSDQAGRTPALQYQDSGILLYAKDMISKRVGRGENINVFDLFNTLVEHVRKMIASGEYAK